MRTFVIAALVLIASLGTFVGVSLAAGAANGAGCFASADCASGYCDGATETCQAIGTQTGVTNTTQTQTGVTNTGVRLINPLNAGTSLENFLLNILQFVIRIGSVVVVLMVVYVGYLFVLAQGNDSKITEARQALLWTVIGALVLLGSQAIALAIKATVQALGS